MVIDLKHILRSNGLSLADLARAMGIDKATVTRWAAGRVPAERALEVERVTGIDRHRLRPDLFAPPSNDFLASSLPQANREQLVNGEAA